MKSNKFILKKYHAIHDAELLLNGLTILSGENGSGKSTISRWIFYLIELSAHYDSYLFMDYVEALEHQVRWYCAQMMRNIYLYQLEERLSSLDSHDPRSVDEAMSLCIEWLKSHYADVREYLESEHAEILKKRILRSIAALDDDIFDEGKLENEFLLKVSKLRKEFYTNSEKRSKALAKDFCAKYFMEHDSFPSSLQFEDDEHNIVSRDKLEMILSFHRVIYIDTPMALSCDTSTNYFWYRLKSMLMQKTKYDLSSPKKKKMEAYIRSIIGGNINMQKGRFNDDELHYVREADGLNIDIKDTATGLKSFAYILRLLENGYLDDKTLLIIDEPEAHLHPQWVVEFARVLVRLHAILGVKVLINSHNPDMVAAIQSIAAKEKALDNTTFYLAEKQKNTTQYNFRNLGHEIDEIFTSFNIAISRIQEYGADVD